MTTELTFIPLDEAVEVANCVGLTADLIRQLARRDKILPWGEIPRQGFVVEKHHLVEIAAMLSRARSEGKDQYINAHEAEQRYGVHRSTWGRYRDRGAIRRDKKDLLYLEDITFIVKLSELVKPKSGRPLFPHSYDPYSMCCYTLDKAT